MSFVSIDYYTIFYFFLQISLDKSKNMIIIKAVDRRKNYKTKGTSPNLMTGGIIYDKKENLTCIDRRR